MRVQVQQAIARARDRVGGRLSDLFQQLAAEADAAGLTRDDFYRAARPESVDKLSGSKLGRLVELLDRAGYGVREEGATAALVRALEALSGTAHVPAQRLAALPRRLLCLRRSYLLPDMVNVSYVEISHEQGELRWHETRAGSVGATSQRSEIRGSVLWGEDAEPVLYVIGHNEFRTSFAVQETVSTRSRILVLSVLAPVDGEGFDVLAGVHAGVIPDNNPDLPGVPYTAAQVLVRTERSLAEAAAADLIRNHPVEGFLASAPWTTEERRLLQRANAPARLLAGLDPRYGVLTARSD